MVDRYNLQVETPFQTFPQLKQSLKIKTTLLELTFKNKWLRIVDPDYSLLYSLNSNYSSNKYYFYEKLFFLKSNKQTKKIIKNIYPLESIASVSGVAAAEAL